MPNNEDKKSDMKDKIGKEGKRRKPEGGRKKGGK